MWPINHWKDGAKEDEALRGHSLINLQLHHGVEDRQVRTEVFPGQILHALVVDLKDVVRNIQQSHCRAIVQP